jgi:hypothetical protein
MFNFQKLYKRYEMELKVHLSSVVGGGHSTNRYKVGSLVTPLKYWEGRTKGIEGIQYRLYVNGLGVQYGHVDLSNGDIIPCVYDMGGNKCSEEQIKINQQHIIDIWKKVLLFWGDQITREGQNLKDMANDFE